MAKCEDCGKRISTAVQWYSSDKYGKWLCVECQKKADGHYEAKFHSFWDEEAKDKGVRKNA